MSGQLKAVAAFEKTPPAGKPHKFECPEDILNLDWLEKFFSVMASVLYRGSITIDRKTKQVDLVINGVVAATTRLTYEVA
jgi:hypothetical protein